MTQSQQKKVQKLYNLIGDRGLYVNTNYDVFTKTPEQVNLGQVGSYSVPLIHEGTVAYSSPLLFATLTSLLNHGTMLITGAPGIGKTTSAELAGHFFSATPLDDILQAEIQGNVQLKTEDVVAYLDTVKMVSKGEKEVLPTNFLKCPIKIWDEVNRTPSDLLSCAMKLVDIGKAVYQGVLLQSPPGSLFATANYSDEGTFQLTPPFLDRFDVAVMVTSPPQWDLQKIRARGDEKLNGDLEERLKIPDELNLDFEKIRQEIKNIDEVYENDFPLVSTFADFVYGSLRFSEVASNNLARATKGNAWQMTQDRAQQGHFREGSFTYTVNELSIRTSKSMLRYAKTFAWLGQKDKVELDDLKAIMPYLLWHKVSPTKQALTENPVFGNDRIAFVEHLLKKIEDDYTTLLASDTIRQYALALNLLGTGKLGDRTLDDKNEIRDTIKGLIQKVGVADNPHALMLAQHISSEYNTMVMSQNE